MIWKKKKKLGSDPTFPITAELLDRCGVVDFSPFGMDIRTFTAIHIAASLLSCNKNNIYENKDGREKVIDSAIQATDYLLRKLNE